MEPRNLRRPTEVPTFEVVDAVARAPFPARRDALARHAQEGDAPENLVESLRRLPDREYSSPDEVEDAYDSFTQRGGT